MPAGTVLDRTGGRRTSTGRIPSLDGLRALSIGAVLLGHMAGTYGAPVLLSTVVLASISYFDIAHFGVRVFFVISGYLITGLLIAELGRTGTISLRQFYFRRTLRIFPAYFALLGVLCLLALAGVISLTHSDLAHAFTYTLNYAPTRSWQVGHFWSLAVEEQFYLLWPLTLLLAGRRRGARIAFGVVLAAPLIRVAEATLIPSMIPLIGNSFETTADALATGCLLALWQEPLESNPRYQKLVASPWIIPLLIGASIIANLRYRPGLLMAGTIENVAVALLIAYSVTYSRGRWGRFLNAKPMVTVGILSYSLYLWQQPFLNRTHPSLLTSFPLNILLAFACAALSYRLVEQPMLALRSRIARRTVATPLNEVLGGTPSGTGVVSSAPIRAGELHTVPPPTVTPRPGSLA